jgi:hypothetical protein
MTELLTPAPGDAPAAPARSRRGQVVAALLVIVLVGAVVWAGWWLTHPDRFAYGNEIAFHPLPVGESVLVDTGLVPGTIDDTGTFSEATVKITSVAPRVVRDDGGDAVLTLWLCQRTDAGAVGSVAADKLPRFCDPATEIEGEVGTFTYAEQQVLLQVTPSGPGRVVIEGVDVTYRDGLRRGTEHAGNRIVVTAVR